MKILLLGKNGQVGWELQRALAPLGTVTALDRHGSDELTGDLGNLDALQATIRRLQPDILVNAAAYTAVDRAESDQLLAVRINGDGPRLLAEEMQALGGWLVHYSTDYVFNGQGTTPWRETDATAPLNHYGHSKLLGEQHVAASGCRHLIFRTSWVYGAHGNNFARTMMRLAGEQEQLRVIADQHGVPTGADLIADVTAHALRCAIANPQLGGLYHLAASGETTWYDYARRVIDHARQQGARLTARAVIPITSDQYPTPAKRPTNSRLDTHKLRHNFGLHLPEWQHGVNRMVEDFYL